MCHKYFCYRERSFFEIFFHRISFFSVIMSGYGDDRGYDRGYDRRGDDRGYDRSYDRDDRRGNF